MKNSRILIADDDRCVRKAMRGRLNAMGFDVVDACDGLGVLAEYIPRGVDAMILDYDMPNGDGQTVARMVRKESDVPIVFLSGYSAGAFKSIVSQLPDVYYLKKPVDVQKLSELLAGVLGAPGGGEIICHEPRGQPVTRILLVDDDPAQTKALAARLEAAGFVVLAVHSAHEATERVFMFRPHLVVLDIDMPGFSGLEFHECLGRVDRGAEMPVVYLSGRDDWVNRQMARQQGAYAFIAKPYEASALLETVREAVRRGHVEGGLPNDRGRGAGQEQKEYGNTDNAHTGG